MGRRDRTTHCTGPEWALGFHRQINVTRAHFPSVARAPPRPIDGFTLAGENAVRDFPFLRIVQSPITAEQLRPPGPECRRVQFSHPLTDRDHEKLARFLHSYPHLQLRVSGHFHENVDFLQHYPGIRHLAVEA